MIYWMSCWSGESFMGQSTFTLIIKPILRNMKLGLNSAMANYNTDIDPVKSNFATYRFKVKNPSIFTAQDKLFNELVKHIQDD